jgi:two-component system chemotaxis response regulator CheB
MTEAARLKVLVIDDSAVARQLLSAVLSSERDIEVQVAADPLIAKQKMLRFPPDVIILDLEMPRMDGLTFLRSLMTENPLPVVVCSNQAENGSETALQALDLGAIDILPKPKVGVNEFLHESAVALIESVRGAAHARVSGLRPPLPADLRTGKPVLPAPRGARLPPTDRVIAVGASTGGTEALRDLLSGIPAGSPPILIVQHMPAGFTAAFARRLASELGLDVREARSGEALAPGVVLVAPGDRHMALRRSSARTWVEVLDGPLVSRHRPSVDILFRSVAEAAGRNGIGLIMTGMGHDGAQGLLEMRQAGARTLAQDESTSVVFGMPREAISRGAVEEVLPLMQLAPALLRAAGCVEFARPPSNPGGRNP